MIPVITIEGPTASGKTALALALAQVLNTEIISADSRQVYKYLDIGTAKPSKDELALIQHHLISIIEPNESFNAGLFRNKAMTIIKRLNQLGKIPIICGGTGLYIKALLEGLFLAEFEHGDMREQLAAEFFEKGLPILYSELTKVDPAYAQTLSCNDKQRILRALEVYRATGIPISEHYLQQGKNNELIPFRILLEEDRAVLYARIDQRVLSMLERGLLKEIETLLEQGLLWSMPGMNSVGYKEFKPYFTKVLSREDCLDKVQQHTRNYAKRQFTWYKKCTFNLADRYSSIRISSVEDKIMSFFEKK